MPEEGLEPPDPQIMIPLHFGSTAPFAGQGENRGEDERSRRLPPGARGDGDGDGEDYHEQPLVRHEGRR
jgi:hypothetical protein